MKAALYNAIKTLLLTDPTLLAALSALQMGSTGGAEAPAKVFKSFRPFAALGQQHYPCWVLEAGDDESIEEAIGSCHQTFETEILLALVWHQQDHDSAFDQRVELPGVVTQLFLRTPRPGDIADVRVDAAGKDRSANHPTHVITFRLLANVDITR